jgi:nucleoside 2-deoxyribosyltransferase
MATHCRLCGQQVASIRTYDRDDAYAVECRTCGSYDVDDMTWALFEKMETEPSDRHLLSALTRTAPVRGTGRVRIDLNSFRDLREGRLPEKTFVEMRDALLDWIAFESRKDRKSPYGAAVKLDSAVDYPVAYCHDLRDGNAAEWNFIVQPLMARGLIEVFNSSAGLIRLTELGWEQVEARRKITSGVQGFIAMSFRDMDQVHQAIAAGVAAAGYRPLRIDGDEFLGGILDRVIARIRESRFVVADLTRNRGGVYYEAGFAFGLGVPVIPLCRRDHLSGDDNRVHFDVQHLNLLPWDEDRLDRLTEQLEARIVSVLGRGPLTPPPAPS